MGCNDEREILSRIATDCRHGENSPYFDGWKAYENDPFDLRRNPGGVIQMGLAENLLCLGLIQEWIRNHPEASICTAKGLSDFITVANFQDYHGFPAFREGIAKLMEKIRGGRVKFDPNRVVMSGGCTGAQEILAFCLANPGDAFLVPIPYYPAFDRDLRWRTGVELRPIHCDSSNDFKVTRTALESAYEEARKANIRVKGVLITNPSNPLGTTMDEHTLQSIVKFVNEKRIHLVCDEIFGGTTFKGPRFVSIAEVIEEDPNCDRNLIHIACSLSKDLGLPGFRVGIVYSYNDAVVGCARKMSSFGLVSSQTQHLLASMLSDDGFLATLLAESANRLQTRHAKFTSSLEEVGIRCLESNAGLFCWMDLRRLLKEATEEGELELWRVIVSDVKLNVSPGSSFHCTEPGWFRVCFANADDETMSVALQRIATRIGALVSRAEAEAEAEAMRSTRTATKKKRWNPVLRVSLPRRFEVEMSRSPSLMSPHSPLVPATR